MRRTDAQPKATDAQPKATGSHSCRTTKSAPIGTTEGPETTTITPFVRTADLRSCPVATNAMITDELAKKKNTTYSCFVKKKHTTSGALQRPLVTAIRRRQGPQQKETSSTTSGRNHCEFMRIRTRGCGSTRTAHCPGDPATRSSWKGREHTSVT